MQYLNTQVNQAGAFTKLPLSITGRSPEIESHIALYETFCKSCIESDIWLSIFRAYHSGFAVMTCYEDSWKIFG